MEYTGKLTQTTVTSLKVAGTGIYYAENTA